MATRTSRGTFLVALGGALALAAGCSTAGPSSSSAGRTATAGPAATNAVAAASWVPDGTGAPVPSPTLGPPIVPAAVIDLPGTAGAVIRVTREVAPDGTELALWAGGDGKAWRIDLKTDAVTSIPVPIHGGDWIAIALHDGDLWGADFPGQRVYRVDPVTGQVLATIATPPGPMGLITKRDEIWIPLEHGGGFAHIDTTDNTIDTDTQPEPGLGAEAGSTWTTREATASAGRAAVKHDAATGKELQVVAIPDGVGCSFLADVHSRVWTWCQGLSETRMAVIDDGTGTLLGTFTTGDSYIGGLADIGGETWAITGSGQGHPSRMLVLGTTGPTGVGADLPAGLDPDGLIKAGGWFWIPSEDGKLYRLAPHDVERLLAGHPSAH